MDAEVKFIESNWDDAYGVSTVHLSYLLQTLLPLHVIKWGSTKRHYLNIKSKLECDQDERIQFIVTGSMAEGYSIPPSIHRQHDGNVPDCEVLSDIDTLWVASQCLISTEEHPNVDSIKYKGHFEYCKESTGYVRICLTSTKDKDDTFVHDESSGKDYLSGTKFTDKIFESLTAREDVTKQGPAISMIDALTANTGNDFSVRDGISKDLVLALPCYPWPGIADGWRERATNSQWINEEVAESIIKDGCHVVGVPSKTSDNPDVEWRLSFSASEGKLARENVSDYQRQCFIYIKILHYQKIKPKGILSSYIFKSVFLHCCETLPTSYWRDHPGNCILYILDAVLSCLRKKHVPTYFLPENNLIRHLTDEEITDAIGDMLDVRSDPLTPILEFTDERLLPHHCVLFTFREMVEPLLNDMQNFKNNRDIEVAVLHGIIPTAYRICHLLISETNYTKAASLFKHQEGIRCLIDVYSLWLRPMKLNATLVEFIEKAGLAANDPNMHVVFFDAVISLEKEQPEFATLKQKVACMFHKYALSQDCTGNKKQEYITKAEDIFKDLYLESEYNAIGYANFLMKEKRFGDARVILMQHIGTCSSATEECTFNHEDHLIEPLKEYVEVNGSISGDSVSFAFFYMLYNLCSDEKANKLRGIVEAFENHYDKMEKNENTFRLINLSKTFLGTEKEEKWSYFSYINGYCSIL